MGASATDPFGPVVARERSAPRPDPSTRLGPLDKVYLIWLQGSSCDGCSVGVTGATHPRLEQLLTGAVPGLPRVVLLHTDFSIESGDEWMETLFLAEKGALDAPFVLTFEGSVPDESLAGTGFWSGLGADPETGHQLTTTDWIHRLAPRAAAVIAIGTCASWGGVPAARGNATGARGVGSVLGDGFRSVARVPLIRIPGCAPPGDNYVEVAAAILLFMNGLAPLPALDDLGRPAWLYRDTVHTQCSRIDDYLSGSFSTEHGGDACLIELGCAGPVAVCNMAERGMIDGQGGCMRFGGICIGCTMPGFPDAFLWSGPAPVQARLVRARTGGFRRRLAALGIPVPAIPAIPATPDGAVTGAVTGEATEAGCESAAPGLTPPAGANCRRPLPTHKPAAVVGRSPARPRRWARTRPGRRSQPPSASEIRPSPSSSAESPRA